MIQKTKKTISVLLSLLMVLSVFGGMSLTAYATSTETLLTTITATGTEQASYSTANVATVSFSNLPNNGSSYTAIWGWWGYGWTATVNAAEGYTITKCVFYDDKDRTATDSEAPFVVETTEEDKTPQVNGTPILAYTSKGITKIEVYGYATPASTHSVTITAGDHMTKTADSGEASQTDLTGAMTDVVYTAADGYYFPENYVASCTVTANSGVSVTRDSYTQITVSGTPTADAEITLGAATAKENQTAPETTDFTVTNATNATSADGEISGVTSAMEYSVDNGVTWTAVSGTSITGLNPGSVQIRLVGDDTHNASDAVTVAVGDQLADAKTTAKGELDTLLAGKTESDYDADDWTALNTAITDGKDNIDAATTTDGVDTAKVDAVAAVNAIKTTAEKLANAKIAAKADLDALLDGKTEADYDAEDWAALTQAITDGKAAIDTATTIDDVTAAKTTAIQNAPVIKTTAEKLADAKTAAKADLDALLDGKTEADYDAEDWAALTQAITDGKAAIDTATTIDDVTAAKTTAIQNAPVIKTTAEKLADAKTAALEELQGYAAADAYREAQQITLADALATGYGEIDEAETIAEVEAALAGAKEVIDAIPTDAELTAQEEAAAAALADAKEDLSAAIEDAKAFYNTIKDDEKYAQIADDLDTAIQQGEAMLNSDDIAEVSGMTERVLGVLESAQDQKATIDEQSETPDEPTEPEAPTKKDDRLYSILSAVIELIKVLIIKIIPGIIDIVK